MSSPVEEIKERLNIIDLIQEYVPLKKTGANHKGRCPFHNEHTPSFTASESKQFFHCFGCGKGGDIFTFIEEIEAIEFAEALRMLAKKANVELKPTNPREHNERTRLLDALSHAASFFALALRESKEGEIARTYVTERAVNPETQQVFQIGYSGDSWDALMNFLKKKGFTTKEMERAGLIIPSAKTRGFYDRFRGRLIFPIHNTHGNVIGFGARTLDPNEKEAKYINSPQSAVYNKSEVLYGLSIAKKYIQKVDATVIVEGYMDVITAHQAKFRNVVAASGTALTAEQIRLLKRYSANIILAFDADAAGMKAAWRGMQLAVKEGMNIKVLVLPDGLDPDDLIRENPQEFRQRAVEAQPFMDHAFQTVFEGLDFTQVIDKKKAAAELLPMIAEFPDALERAHYIQLLAKTLSVSEKILEEKIAAARAPKKGRFAQEAQAAKDAQKNQQNQLQQPKTRVEQMTERLIALVSLIPQDFGVIVKRMKDGLIVGEEILALYKYLESEYNQRGTVSLDSINTGIGNSESTANTWKRLELVADEQYGEMSPIQLQQELLTLLESLERERIKYRLKLVEQKLAAAESSHDTSAIQELSEEFRALAELLRKLG